MRVFLTLILFALSCTSILNAQKVDREAQAEEVKAAVGTILGRTKPKVEIVLRDLTEVKGKIVGLYADSFAVKMKGPKKPLFTITIIGKRPTNAKGALFIKYEDVLQLESKGVALSFVPDPKRLPYATWDDVRAIGVGETLHIETIDGKRHGGVFMNASTDSLSLMRGNTKSDFDRKKIVRVFRVRGGSGGVSNAVRAGQKGRDITDEILPIGDARARAHPAAQGIGAGIGALLYLLPKGTKRILVFSQ